MKLLIVGCERSGTTAIASLISKGSGLKFLNDPKDSWYIYPLVKMIGIRGFTFSMLFRMWKYRIVKIPGFASILPQIRKVHPRMFKIVYLVRDPRDNYAAIKERLQVDLNGLYLNVHFLDKKGKTMCENIALRWLGYMEVAEAYEKKYPNDIKFIRYEDFLKNKIKIIQDISDFAYIKINIDKLEEYKDIQINKSWSNTIRGAGRYKNELELSEIETINSITKKYMNKFKY